MNMSMYKRPLLRVREPPRVINGPAKVPPGTFLHGLINPPPTEFYKWVKQPIYRKDDYLALLKKNCKELGLEYKEPDIPEYVPAPKLKTPEEPEIIYPDWVYMKVKVLKSGVVRIKLDASLATLYEKYYSKNKFPPVKSIIQAYKSLGFSKEFLERTKKKFDNKAEISKKIGAIIDKVFNKEPVKKIKKKKEEPPEEIEEEDPRDDEEDPREDEPEEDEGMDVEMDEDPDEQPQEEEEYFSDGGD